MYKDKTALHSKQDLTLSIERLFQRGEADNEVDTSLEVVNAEDLR